MAPALGLPSASPFCIKLETWLKMAELPYEVRVVQGPPRSSNGKVPWVELGDGRRLADSGAIMATLAQERSVSLDAGLDERSRALAVAITRVLEDHLYWAVVCDRWRVSSHWAQTRVAYFGAQPVPLRWLVPAVARRGVLRALHGQGFGRLDDDAVIARARHDLGALAELLDDQEHWLGRPSSLDATAYAFLASAASPPFDGPLQRAVAQHSNLIAFIERMQQRWW